MAKVCVKCQDGQTYPDAQSRCSVCGEYLWNVDPLKARSSQTAPKTGGGQDPYADALRQDLRRGNSQPAPPQEPPARLQRPVLPQRPPEPKVPPSDAGTPEVSWAAEGIVRNLTEDQVEESYIFRWFRSLRYGIPFMLDHTMTSFQIFAGDGAQADAEEGAAAILYGKVVRGKLANGCRVRVWGRRDATNCIIVSAAENLTTKSTLAVNAMFGPTFVRVISGIVGAFFVLMILAGASTGIEGLLSALFSILIIPIALIVGWFWLKRQFGSNRRGGWF